MFGGLFGRDVAIDLGTANTLVFVKGQGIVLSEPSVVAIDTKTDKVVAVGSTAKRMLGRTPGNIVAMRPLKDGVIADFEVTEKMLAYFIRRVQPQRLFFRSLVGPRVVVCVPSGVTGVELKAVKEATESAGARQAYTIEEPLAAAIGCGLPVNEAQGSMVVDVGGGTSEVAVISLGGIVTKSSIRIAGDDIDDAISTYIQKEYKLAIGTQTAEQLKIELGSAFRLDEEESAEIRGRDLVTGLPKTVVITSEEIREAISVPVDAVLAAVRDTLDRTPPELASDIMDRGMILAGGGALLRQFSPIIGFIDGGTRVLTSSATDGSTAIRDATTLRSVRRFPGAGARAAVSPDGRLAALAPVNGRLRLLDLATGRARLIRGDGGSVTALRFTPDSHWLVIARGDAPPLVWDVRREIPLKTLAGLRNVTQLTIVADGTTLYGAGKQGDVTAWDLTGARGLQRSFRTGPTSAAVFAVTPGSQTFAVANRAGYVDLLDSRTLDRTARIHAPAATRIAISRDGRTIATADRAGAVGFIDLQTGRPLGTAQHAHIGRVLSLAFSPRGDWLASSGADRAVYLWDARRRRPVKLYSIPPGSALPPTGLSFNPDGTRLAVAIAHSDGTGELDVLSVPRFALVAKVPVAPGGQTEFSRDGRRLLYRDDSGQVWTIDTRTWRVRGLTVGGRAKPGDFALAPDNRRLATTSGDGTAQLWDISSGRTIGSPLGVGVTRPVSATFVAGGTALVTLADDGRGAVWDLRPRAWQTRACTIAGRPLTRAEWRHVLPDRPYEPACAHGAG